MANEQFEVSEEIEILIAKRLLGEISKDENLKLELFLQDNPEIKKSYFEKEGVKRLLVNAADNLEELHLPAEKKKLLLNQASSKNSGKVILYTYTVAAVVFFSFMFGIYFYANHKLQIPEKTAAFKDGAKSDESNEALPVAVNESLSKEHRLDKISGKDVKAGNDAFGKKDGKSIPQGEAGSLQDLVKGLPKENEKEEKSVVKAEEAMDYAEDAKTNKAVGGKQKSKQGGYKEMAKSAPENNKLASPPAASSVAPIIVKEATPAKPLAPSKEAEDKSVAKSESKSERASIVAEKKAASNSLEDSDGGQKDKKPTEGSLKKSDKGGVQGYDDQKMLGEIATKSKNSQYIAQFKFNESTYNIKFFSSIDLNKEENIKALTLRQFLNIPDVEEKRRETDALKQKEALREAKEEAPKIQIDQFQTLDSNASIVEAKGNLGYEISKEIAMIHTCYQQFKNRNQLTSADKKKLLEELKKSLVSIVYFKKDLDLKNWLAEIEKELKSN